MTAAPPSDRVVIAVDPHKASWTAAALDSSLQPLDVIRVGVSREGYRQLRRFARRWSNPGWAIEGAAGLGAPLTQRLNADGVEVIDVPAKLAARVRVLSTGHGRKTDEADAVSVGIAAMTATRLNTASVVAAVTALRALVEHRDDLVKIRTQTLNRLHVLLTHLTPAGAPRGLTAARAADILRQIRPRDHAAKTLRSLAVDLVTEIRQLDRRIAKAASQILIERPPPHPQTTELPLGVSLRVLRFLLGSQYAPLSVHLPREPLTPAAHYLEFFRCRPYFAQSVAGFTLRTADLGRPHCSKINLRTRPSCNTWRASPHPIRA